MVNIYEACFEKREAQGLSRDRCLTNDASPPTRCILILVAQDSMILYLVSGKQWVGGGGANLFWQRWYEVEPTLSPHQERSHPTGRFE
jgi:hypothetical protein